MKRSDISPLLVHFVKGDSDPEAYGVLRAILRESSLRGGTGFIKGAYPCVCFSEAPLQHLEPILRKPGVHGIRYRAFGVIVTKVWAFERGGRPVIYQPDSEFLDLKMDMRWRHVRYEPNASPPTDFSWEREWRVHCMSLPIQCSEVGVLVPTDEWIDRLKDDLDADNVEQAKMYADLTGAPEEMFHSADTWSIFPLSHSGTRRDRRKETTGG